MQVMRMEGEDNGEWIIVDCGAAVVHVMQPAIRDYYHLEEIWGGKPVKLKLGDDTVRLVKASEGDDEDEAPARRPARKAQAATKPGVPGKSPAAKKAAAAAPAAKKAPAKKGVTRVVGVKTPASKTIKVGAAKPAAKPAARKVAAKKATPAKSAARPAAVKTAAKPAAKKVARKTS